MLWLLRNYGSWLDVEDTIISQGLLALYFYAEFPSTLPVFLTAQYVLAKVKAGHRTIHAKGSGFLLGTWEWTLATSLWARTAPYMH